MVEVYVSKYFPYESLDPDKPGKVHGAMVLGKFYCSKYLFERLSKLPARERLEAVLVGEGIGL